MRVVIVGAGIGGLATAALLSREGHRVTVVETARELGDVGAGIQMSPNGVRVLDRLELGAAAREIGCTPDRIVIRRWRDDSELMTMPMGDLARQRWGQPYYSMYRPEVIEILASRCDGVDLRLGSRVVSVDHDVPSVTLASSETISADVVVGADGIHSVVRNSAFGRQSTRFSGFVAYRALVPRAEVDDLPVEVTNRVGPDAHIVSYFVGRERRFLNLVCIYEDREWDVESWNEPGDPEVLRARFADWSPSALRVLDRVREPVFRWALHDREPLARWSRGATTLLGDACHPMVPFMAQGACQALEDAAALTDALSTHDDVREALDEYESRRRPRTADIQSRSFANASTYHLHDGQAQEQRDAAYAAASRRGVDGLAAFDWLYGRTDDRL
jgi:salicylate hydroxylase